MLLYPLFRSVIHVSLGFVSQEIYHYILFVLFFSPVNASPLRHFLLCAKPDSRLDWKNSFPFILIIWFLLAMYFENYQRQVFHVNPKPGSAGTCLKLELRQGADIQSLKRDGTRAETRFLPFGETDESILNLQGRQFSRLLAVAVCASAVAMLDTPSSEVV